MHDRGCHDERVGEVSDVERIREELLVVATGV
jgi:hypothetical protein